MRNSARPSKKIIGYSANKYRVFYNFTRYFKLVESESADLDEPLYVINPLYASASGAAPILARTASADMQPMIFVSLNRVADKFNESLIMKTTPRDALLGRKVKMLSAMKKMAATFDIDSPLTKKMPPNDTVGYIHIMNGTYSGPYEVYTGYGASRDLLGEVVSFEGRTEFPWWKGHCRQLQGSAGELRPMPINSTKRLGILVPQSCRLLQLEPVEVIERIEGRTIVYRFAQDSFRSATSNPMNRCFCVDDDPKGHDHCSLDGVLDLSQCSDGAPILLNMGGISIDQKIIDTFDGWRDHYNTGRVEFCGGEVMDHSYLHILEVRV
ncbi:Sensory neuron membrane protein 2, partial [Fragariocoptes setiger]